MLDVIQRAARLRKFAEASCLHVEETGGACLSYRDINASQVSPVHSNKALQVGAGIDYGDIAQDSQVAGFLDRSVEDERRPLQRQISFCCLRNDECPLLLIVG